MAFSNVVRSVVDIKHTLQGTSSGTSKKKSTVMRSSVQPAVAALFYPPLILKYIMKSA